MPEFHAPIRLIWGEKSLDCLPELMAQNGITRPFLVSDARILDGPAGRLLLDLLGDGVAIFDGCGIDARVTDVETCADRMQRDGLDGVIGLGGGSALCTAKGAAIAAKNGPVRALEGLTRLPEPPLPMILIPTTAGSGTEVSPFTILRDDADGAKFTVGGSNAFAAAAILDPLSLEGLPRGVAIPAAMDALCHALEAACSLRATPVSDALALRAARLLFGSIERSLAGDPQARTDNLLGSALANLACGQARLGHAHRLARPVESATGATHGQVTGALLPLTLPAALEARCGILAELGAALDLPDATPEAVSDAVAALCDRLGLARHLPRGAVEPERIARKALHRRGEPPVPEPVTPQSVIPAANGQKMTLAQATGLLERLLRD